MTQLIFNARWGNEDDDILSPLKAKMSKPKEIRQGMSSEELADIVSDRLITVIKQQFAETEKKFRARKK